MFIFEMFALHQAYKKLECTEIMIRVFLPLSAFLSVLATEGISNKRDQTSQISLDTLDKPQLISKVRGRDRE